MVYKIVINPLYLVIQFVFYSLHALLLELGLALFGPLAHRGDLRLQRVEVGREDPLVVAVPGRSLPRHRGRPVRTVASCGFGRSLLKLWRLRAGFLLVLRLALRLALSRACISPEEDPRGFSAAVDGPAMDTEDLWSSQDHYATIRMGDVDADGKWRVLGRRKNLVVPAAGHNVAPAPISAHSGSRLNSG